MKEVVDDYHGGFGAIKFHNYFWAHYDSLVSIFNSHFILGCILLHNLKYST